MSVPLPFSLDTPYASQRQPVMGRMAVATSHPLAAQVGLQQLASGGTAMDAALAAAIALTVVEPTGNGVGSDAFCLYWDGSELHGLNASGWSPAGWTAERFAGLRAMPGVGWDTVTVPGAVRGWAAAAARFARRSLGELVQPAVQIAREGHRVAPIIARQWAEHPRALAEIPGFLAHFCPGGRAPAAGDIWRNAELAASLEDIGQTNGESLYCGPLAERLLTQSRVEGGALSAADLAEWQPEWCGSLSGPVLPGRAWRLHEIPPNGQGIAALVALGLLAHTDVTEAAVDSPRSLHLQIEAMKLALADTYAQVSDPAAMTVTGEAMLDPGYLAERARLIDPARAAIAAPGRVPGGGTVYLSACDAQGRMASWIQSNFNGFGSGVVVRGTGIHLHNRGEAFSLDPTHPNAVGPRKRPFHTIIPGMLCDAGGARLSFGVMGAAMQAQGHVQMMLRVLVHGQNPQAALDAPRWRVLGGRAVALEPGLDASVYETLRAMGHEVQPSTGPFAGFGGGQLIWKTAEGDYIAGSEPRKDGAAVAL